MNPVDLLWIGVGIAAAFTVGAGICVAAYRTGVYQRRKDMSWMGSTDDEYGRMLMDDDDNFRMIADVSSKPCTCFIYTFADGTQVTDHWLSEDALMALVRVHGNATIGMKEV